MTNHAGGRASSQLDQTATVNNKTLLEVIYLPSR